MALHSEFGRAGIEIIGFTRHQSGKKVDSDHKSVKHGLTAMIVLHCQDADSCRALPKLRAGLIPDFGSARIGTVPGDHQVGRVIDIVPLMR